MPTEYLVQEGECLASIAEAFGFFWQTIWDDPANAELKKLRANPYVLLAGDTVVIPDKTVKSLPCATGKRHVFRRRGVPIPYKLRLLRNGKPRAAIEYTLIVDDDVMFGGKTDGDGWLQQHYIPAQSKKAVLRIGDSEEYALGLGELDPVTEESGVRTRLHNLRYLRSRNGSADDLKAAIAACQTKASLEATGVMDDATRDALVAEHGS